MAENKLLVRLPNWVGDVVMALPSIEALHAAGFELICLGRPWINDLLSAYDFHCLSLSADFDDTLAQIDERHLEYALCFPNSLSSAWLFKRAKLKTFGYRGDWRRLLLYKSWPQPKELHQVRQYLALAKHTAEQLGLEWPAEVNEIPQLKLSAAAKQKAQQLIAEIAQPFEIACPLAVGTYNGQSKIWPHWQAFGEQCQRENKTLVCCPGPGELQQTEEVLPQAKILDQLSLSEMAAVMTHAQRVHANDSGPMHIAAAVGAPLTAHFGPSDPNLTGPLRSQNVEMIKWDNN